jgi:hypothetical protein
VHLGLTTPPLGLDPAGPALSTAHTWRLLRGLLLLLLLLLLLSLKLLLGWLRVDLLLGAAA